MPHVTIKLFATLNRFSPDSPDRYAIEPGTTVDHLLKKLSVPKDDVRLVFINGIRCNLTSPLKDGDRVGVFPPVGGG